MNIDYLQRETSIPTPTAAKRHHHRKTKQTELAVAAAQKEQIKQDRAAMWERLKNWGRWRNKDEAEIEAETGQIKISMSGRLIAYAPFHEDQTPTKPPTPIDEEDAEAVHLVYKALPDDHRGAIDRFFIHHMSDKFVSDIHRCSISTVKRRRRDAVDALVELSGVC